jgi:hypothetical protein
MGDLVRERWKRQAAGYRSAKFIRRLMLEYFAGSEHADIDWPDNKQIDFHIASLQTNADADASLPEVSCRTLEDLDCSVRMATDDEVQRARQQPSTQGRYTVWRDKQGQPVRLDSQAAQQQLPTNSSNTCEDEEEETEDDAAPAPLNAAPSRVRGHRPHGAFVTLTFARAIVATATTDVTNYLHCCPAHMRTTGRMYRMTFKGLMLQKLTGDHITFDAAVAKKQYNVFVYHPNGAGTNALHVHSKNAVTGTCSVRLATKEEAELAIMQGNERVVQMRTDVAAATAAEAVQQEADEEEAEQQVEEAEEEEQRDEAEEEEEAGMSDATQLLED